MSSETLKFLEYVIAGSVFGLVFALWLAGVLVLTIRRRTQLEKIEKRLGISGDEAVVERELSLWLDDRAVTTKVPGLGRTNVFQRFEQLCQDAGWQTPAGVVLLGVGGVTFFVALLVTLASGGVLPGACAGLGGFMIFWFYLKHAVAKRQAIFETQLVDALDLAARSLRAGHPLLGAFQLISEEVGPPVSAVFSEICQQQALGRSLEEALQGVAEKTASDDMKLFATSVIIQVRSGGNLSDMMERLAAVIRDRMRLSRRVRVLTAQTQFSKRILLALPFVIFVVLNIINSGYMRPLHTTTQGRMLLALGGVLLLSGAWMMNRMARLRY